MELTLRISACGERRGFVAREISDCDLSGVNAAAMKMASSREDL